MAVRSDGNVAFNDVCVQGTHHDSIFMSTASASPFLGGPSSMLSFQDDKRKKSSDKSVFTLLYDQEENGDDELDEYFHQPDKKKRLTVEQLDFLEKSFVVENKLEPERKSELAKELGLQPRQVAIWFQNRRARWKTKQLEKDYEALLATYNSLKSDYDNLLKEKDSLKDEIASITELQGNGNLKSLYADNVIEAPSKQQCAKSDGVFDSDNSPCSNIEGVRPSLLEFGDSSYVFEPDQSDISQDEEDNNGKNLLHHQYLFINRMEDACYSDPSSSNYLGFDHAFDFW